MKINIDGAIRVLKANGFECDELKTSPASVPEGQALWDSVYKTLRDYNMTMMVDSDGNGYPLIDAMSPEHGTVTIGIEECTYLADTIYNDLLAAAPTPPVSEDRKDAERYRWHIKLWAEALGMSEEAVIEELDLEIAKAVREDKP